MKVFNELSAKLNKLKNLEQQIKNEETTSKVSASEYPNLSSLLYEEKEKVNFKEVVRQCTEDYEKRSGMKSFSELRVKQTKLKDLEQQSVNETTSKVSANKYPNLSSLLYEEKEKVNFKEVVRHCIADVKGVHIEDHQVQKYSYALKKFDVSSHDTDASNVESKENTVTNSVEKKSILTVKAKSIDQSKTINVDKPQSSTTRSDINLGFAK
ncbi:hypothetical protein E1H99_09020 [Enterococcus hirae]|nr:hypothetical protein E1H99_09020 [Enterococcus hirae]